MIYFKNVIEPVPTVRAGRSLAPHVCGTKTPHKLLTDPTITIAKPSHFYHSFTKPKTLTMAPTKEYALLCLENPLLGMCSFDSFQLKIVVLL